MEVKDYFKYNLLESFRKFYMDKLSSLDEMSDFKRRYMIDVTKLLINDSYLSEMMKGEMPQEMKEFFDKYID